MAEIEIVRSRCWLEVGGTPDGPEDGSEGTIFPVTHVQINASVNSIPTATVTVALGKRVQDGKASPIHGEKGSSVRSPRNWPWARVYYKNLQTDKMTVIFKGFVDGSNQLYSFESTEISLRLCHWAYAMDAHPCISSLSNPASAMVYTEMLYYTSIDATIGTGGIGDSYQGVLFSTMCAHKLDTSIEGSLKEDVIQHGVKTMLEFVTEMATTYVPWSRIDPSLIKLDLPLTVEDILENYLKTGDTLNENPVQDEFPILKLQQGAWYEDMSLKMYEAMANIPAQSLTSNSMWRVLIELAGMFEFMIVPRVHEMRFIPKWYVPPVTDPKVLEGTVSIQPEWTFNRPIGAVVTLPSTLADQDLTPIDFPPTADEGIPPPTISIDDLSAVDAYGIYIPKDKIPGTLLVRQREDWMGRITDMSLGICDDYNNEEATESTTTSADGTPADVTEKEAAKKGLYHGLAEEAYWDEFLRGRQATVLSPIRFDICPGSTVKIRTGGDVRLQARNQDMLSSEFIGFVTDMRISIDTINATASTHFGLSHVRDAQQDAQALENHPMYQCGPFSNATWTKERFKTVTGTE